MRKINFLFMLVAVAMVSMFTTSCKEDFSEEEAIRLNQNSFNDSIQKKGALVNYTVQVVAVGDASNLKSANGVATGAIVTTVQYGKTAVDTVGADGIAYFPAMRVGEVAVHIHLAGHTSVNALVYLTNTVTNGATATTLTNAATQIALFPTTGAQTATIKGRVTVQSDLTTFEREQANGAVVNAYINTNGGSFAADYINALSGQSFATGQVQKISYSSSLSTGVVANGEYSLIVPASAKGLPINVVVSDYVADQKICLPTLNNLPNVVDAASGIVETVRAVFKPGSSASSVATVTEAQVIIEDPTGPQGNPSTAATITYGASGGSIVSFNITNAGAGYSLSNLPTLYIIDANGTGTGGALTVTGLTTGGGFNTISITGGSNYTTTTTGTVHVIMNQNNQVAKASVTVADGVITGITLDAGKAGKGYIKNPSTITVTILPTVVGKGSGATAQISSIGANGALSIKLTNGGSGYYGKNNAGAQNDDFGSAHKQLTLVSGATSVLDIFLGTGIREVNQ